jgi:N-acetylneuraminate lyase
VPVISHVGTIRTRDVIELADHALNAGAVAVSMIPPYYYKFSMDEITDYYNDVAKALPGAPIIIYNVPQFTGIEFNKENAGKLLSGENIIGIKHTSNNLYSLEQMGTTFPDKVLFNGFDEQYLAALSMGAKATIGTMVNLFAPLFRAVRDAYDAGNMDLALRWQKALNSRVETCCEIGIFNAMKYGYHAKGIECGFCRKPFRHLDENAMERMDQLMQQPLEPIGTGDHC